jgi:hypothetical protein
VPTSVHFEATIPACALNSLAIVMIFDRCCRDPAFTVKLIGRGWAAGGMMTPNQSLLVCDAVLERLDAALEVANTEATNAKAAERRIEALLSDVRQRGVGPDSEIRVSPPDGHLASVSQKECAANDNPMDVGKFPPLAFLERRRSSRTRASA